jgi:hypothetical protein
VPKILSRVSTAQTVRRRIFPNGTQGVWSGPVPDPSSTTSESIVYGMLALGYTIQSETRGSQGSEWDNLDSLNFGDSFLLELYHEKSILMFDCSSLSSVFLQYDYSVGRHWHSHA